MSERLIAVLRIPGEPIGKGRPRMAFTGHVYTPQRTRDKEEEIAFLAKSQGCGMAHGHVKATIDAFFKLPKSMHSKAAQMVGKPCDKRPDADNITKLVLDALNGVCFDDDKQIIDLTTRKFWDYESHVDVVLHEVIYD